LCGPAGRPHLEGTCESSGAAHRNIFAGEGRSLLPMSDRRPIPTYHGHCAESGAYSVGVASLSAGPQWTCGFVEETARGCYCGRAVMRSQQHEVPARKLSPGFHPGTTRSSVAGTWIVTEDHVGWPETTVFCGGRLSSFRGRHHPNLLGRPPSESWPDFDPCLENPEPRGSQHFMEVKTWPSLAIYRLPQVIRG